jgi:hypothetical protein
MATATPCRFDGVAWQRRYAVVRFAYRGAGRCVRVEAGGRQ